MLEESRASLQDTFLGHVQEQSLPVTLFLAIRVKLQGYVTISITLACRSRATGTPRSSKSTRFPQSLRSRPFIGSPARGSPTCFYIGAA